MARSIPPFQRLRQRLAAYRWRRVGLLAGISLGLSLTLILYLFGSSDHFFGRLFSAFFVWFSLLTVTFLVAIPFIGWATQHWFGRSWSGEDVGTAKRRPSTTTPATRQPTARRSSTTII